MIAIVKICANQNKKNNSNQNNLLYFFLYSCWISLLVVACSAFLSSLNFMKRGNRNAKPRAWLGLLVISAANTSTTMAGSNQTSGLISLTTTRAGLCST